VNSEQEDVKLCPDEYWDLTLKYYRYGIDGIQLMDYGVRGRMGGKEGNIPTNQLF